MILRYKDGPFNRVRISTSDLSSGMTDLKLKSRQEEDAVFLKHALLLMPNDGKKYVLLTVQPKYVWLTEE